METLLLVEQCYQKLPEEIRKRPWEVTAHGRKVLQTETELDAYIAAYGEMHIIKCRAALQNFPFDDLRMYSYEIFDWGCGQGIASLTFLDMLQERNVLVNLKKIYLIEPSIYALNRAKAWVGRFAGPGVEVIAINKYIPQNIDEVMPEVFCSSRVSVNLFSNILDIRTLSLAWLANKTGTLANVNYMVCIGPKFKQETNTRMADFCGYFAPPNYFSNIDLFPYAYTTKTHHAFGCETKCFVHKKEEVILSDFQECADVSEYQDSYDYAAECLSGVLNDETIKFYNKLRECCSGSYEIFLRPMINCDIVDILLISKSKGVVLINTCEDLANLEEEYNRIRNIKENLFNIHLRSIKVESVSCKSIYNSIKNALFFPYASHEEINEKIAALFAEENTERREEQDRRGHNKSSFEYLYRFTPATDACETFDRINGKGFKYDYYEELINLISSNWHSYKDGDRSLKLNAKQKEIVRSTNKRLRVKGVAGCGKTQVVANRAVEQHLRTGAKVLIITYNISLVQYIKMRISQVPADFSPNMFEITNYHQFFRSMAHRYANDIPWEASDNPKFFEPYKGHIGKYQTIIIDEVQDFKKEWLESIINYFLAEDGSISIFGDGEQNIYDREMEKETRMPPIPTFKGRWNEINERISMRILNPEIANLSFRFAQSFISDDTLPLSVQQELHFENYYIKYWLVNENCKASILADNIRWIIENFHLQTTDVSVLAQTISLLREIENHYVQATNQKAMINFETVAQYEDVRRNTNSKYLINKDLDGIRRVAKTHFTTACEEIKFSTIHSFKGWESHSVILILQPENKLDERYEGYQIQARENIPALIYTALTRAKCNLFIINLENYKYDSFFKNNIK